MAETAAPPRPAQERQQASAYAQDLVLWSKASADLIPARQFELIDWPDVAEETSFAPATFPKSLPCTPEQILQDAFFPGPIDDEA